MAKSQFLVQAVGMNEWFGISLRSLTVHLSLPRAKEAPLGWDRWARRLGKQPGAHSPARIYKIVPVRQKIPMHSGNA